MDTPRVKAAVPDHVIEHEFRQAIVAVAAHADANQNDKRAAREMGIYYGVLDKAYRGKKLSRSKAAIKLHTLLDLRGDIPTFIQITDGLTHEVNILDQITPEHGAFYVMDRGYLDFERLFRVESSNAFFVIRTKNNLRFERIHSAKVDKKTGLLCDQTIRLTGFYSALNYFKTSAA